MTLWRLEKAGKFPARRRLGMNSVAWLEEDVNTWIASRPAIGQSSGGAIQSVSTA
jgi:prophage regulatory protein